jgi:hypothetical protein
MSTTSASTRDRCRKGARHLVCVVDRVAEGPRVGGRRVKFYVELASSERVTSTVIRQLGLDTSPGELASRITTASPADSVVIDLFVVDGFPSRQPPSPTRPRRRWLA